MLPGLKVFFQNENLKDYDNYRKSREHTQVLPYEVDLKTNSSKY